MVTARSLALMALVLLVSGSAHAQSRLGAFTTWNPWWLHPTLATLGINWDGSVIRLDRNGDGTNESVFVRPPGIPDAAITSLRLTPTRTIVYAFGGSCNAGNGTLVHFHRVPVGGDRLEPIVTNLCIPNGIDRFGFYDTGLCAEPNGPGAGLECSGHTGVSPQRIAFFMTAAEFGFENFIWVDLESGVTAGPGFDFSTGLGFIHVSPSGTQAFIQHDLPVNGETDYRLVDLCPGRLGQVVNAGGFPLLDQTGQLSAEVVGVTNGEVEIEVSPTSPQVSFKLSDCLSSTGACCSQSGCITDQFNQAQCSAYDGSFLGAGTACSECPEPPVLEACCFETGQSLCDRLSNAACIAQGGDPQEGVDFCGFDTCPTAQPAIALGGAASGGVGDTLTYVLDYENQGGIPAPLVEIEVQLPYGATFDGADNGGDFDGATVRWQLGSLAAGASGSVSFTFTFGCDAADGYVYMQALISHAVTPDGSSRTYAQSDPIEYAVESAAFAPITVTLDSTPAGDPLHPGETVEHAITLTNANAEALADVALGSNAFTPDGIPYGNGASFASVIDAAGGTVDTSQNRFEWTGDLPGGASRTIRFSTSISACLSGGIDETSLAFGGAITAFDQCENPIGTSNDPETFAIESLVEASIAATNLAPPQHLEAPIIDIDVQVTRPGAPLDVTVELRGTAGQAIPGVAVSALLRGMNVTTPPSGPGVTWDPVEGELAWAGTIPASGSVAIPFQATLAACRGEIALEGSSSPACAAVRDIRGETTVAAVPEPPPGPWIAAMGPGAHPFFPGNPETQLLRVDPGPPSSLTTMLCLPSESVGGMGASPNGDIWVSWLPTYRVNPRTLEFQTIALDEISDAGVDSLDDIAVDPVDGSVYFAGSEYDVSGHHARIARYDPVADTFTPFYEDSGYDMFEQVVADGQGSLALQAYVGGQNMLARLDLAAPNALEVLYDPPSSLLTDIAVDRDGSYLVIDGYFSATAVIYDVDPATAERSTVVPSLQTLFPTPFAWGQLEVDPQERLIVAPAQAGLGRIDRATPEVGEVIHPFSGSFVSFTDLALVAAPEPGAAASFVLVLGVLAALSRQRR